MGAGRSDQRRDPLRAFRAINPNGKIPVLQLEDGTNLWESNAILNYLADGSAFLPSDPRLRTQVLQWQFFEQYSHEPYLSRARYIKVFEGNPDACREEYEAKCYDGYHALDVMEQQLKRTPFLVGDACSIADVALYPFTSLAEESGFDLSNYPAIRAWLQRVAACRATSPSRRSRRALRGPRPLHGIGRSRAIGARSRRHSPCSKMRSCSEIALMHSRAACTSSSRCWPRLSSQSVA